MCYHIYLSENQLYDLLNELHLLYTDQRRVCVMKEVRFVIDVYVCTAYTSMKQIYLTILYMRINYYVTVADFSNLTPIIL